MKNYGRASVSDFLGDRVVYRNLAPYDSRLPGLAELHDKAGLPAGVIPRKSQPDYARLIVLMLQAARSLDLPGASLKRLIFVGDTRLNDSTAYSNICHAGGWPGLAFIGSENSAPAAVEIVQTSSGRPLYLANRWSALADFDGYCAEQGFPIDESTAVIVDLDKTALGARGRNAHVIDQARVQAVKDTVASLLGADFDEAAFREAYDLLNQMEYHSFTSDNQDYLAYICLVLGSGLYQLDTVVSNVQAGQLTTFRQFIDQVDACLGDLKPALAQIHTQIYASVLAGDPTPFKAFRRNEYRATFGRMGYMPDNAPLDDLLAGEILITQEVRAAALDWLNRGALLFGLSDKPDEASIPTPELAEQGFRPLHQAVTHAVGSG